MKNPKISLHLLIRILTSKNEKFYISNSQVEDTIVFRGDDITTGSYIYFDLTNKDVLSKERDQDRRFKLHYNKKKNKISASCFNWMEMINDCIKKITY
jgi:hypothetical protein